MFRLEKDDLKNIEKKKKITIALSVLYVKK